MFKTLSAKLSAVLLGLLCLIGALYIGFTLFSTQLYLHEVNQQVNRTLAQHLVSENSLMEGSHINKSALEQLFQMLMMINPGIEIYLLDTHGQVIAHSVSPEKIVRNRIALQPIQEFLGGVEEMPIFGDDPQDATGQKVFSVAPIPAKSASQTILPGGVAGTGATEPANAESSIAGYLYVVLGGQAYDSAAEMLQGSYILRLSTWVVAASILFALLAGLFLFKLLTRRLTRLTREMEAFKYDDLPGSTIIPGKRPALISGSDEIDRLQSTFKRMEERIQQQMQTLKQTDLQRRELVANVSHDLRTPLASLQGYIETLLLKEGRLTGQETRGYLEIALRHSERLGKLITELFELAKLDAQVAPLTLEPFALGELAHDVVQELQLSAQKKNITLETRIQTDPLFVCADIGLIERVLENIIENALRYTPEEGMVTVAVARLGNIVKVEIMDTGCGISSEDLPFIFDRSYRVEKARQQQAGGSGLGLAIAKRILELHGSFITAASTVDRGTTFSFDLPVFDPVVDATDFPFSLTNFSHKVFNDVLHAHVKNGLVNYCGFAADKRLDVYLEQLNRIDPELLPARAERLAYWINAYNAFAIKGILDGCSPRRLIGRYRYFISKEFFAGGEKINLYDLEHKILISQFNDPRIHFAIVCASASCPKLQSHAFIADQLEAQLEQSATNFINDPLHNRFDRMKKIAHLSMIFKWFEKDFLAQAGSLINYLRPYIADPTLAQELAVAPYTIKFLNYDWSSNGPLPVESS